MTFLSIAQAFTEEYNLPVPLTLQGSSDAGVLQIRRLMDKVGLDLRARSNWQVLSRRAVWTSIAGEDQGAIDTLLIENQEHIIPETFWNMTLRRPVYGPVSDTRWQQLKAFIPGSPLHHFRIAGGRLLLNPAMTAGQSLSLIYKTKNWIIVAGTNPVQYVDTIAADTGTPVFREELMLLGLQYMWRKAKQMSSQKEELVYVQAALDAASVDNVKPVIRMDDDSYNSIRPGIFVPQGNWTK